MPETTPDSAYPPRQTGVTGWEHFHHVADVGVRGSGPCPGQAFEQAAMAMIAVVSDPESVNALDTIEFRCEAPNLELLLVDWLNAVVYEIATRKMLLSRFEVTIDGPRLEGKLWGEAVMTEKHHPAVEVKGATFTSLRVAQEADGRWVAQCVVDV